MPDYPDVKWAQSSHSTDHDRNTINLMVKLSGIDPASVKVDLTEDGLSFKCITRDDKKDYGFDLEFYDKIVPSTSAKEWTSNGYICVLRKKTLGKEYWPRLTKGEGDNAYIKVDSEKWVDENKHDQVAGDVKVQPRNGNASWYIGVEAGATLDEDW